MSCKGTFFLTVELIVQFIFSPSLRVTGNKPWSQEEEGFWTCDKVVLFSLASESLSSSCGVYLCVCTFTVTAWAEIFVVRDVCNSSIGFEDKSIKITKQWGNRAACNTEVNWWPPDVWQDRRPDRGASRAPRAPPAPQRWGARSAQRRLAAGGGSAGRARGGGRWGSLFPLSAGSPRRAAPRGAPGAGSGRRAGSSASAAAGDRFIHTGEQTRTAPPDRVSASPRRAPRGCARRAAVCVCSGEGLSLVGGRSSQTAPRLQRPSLRLSSLPRGRQLRERTGRSRRWHCLRRRPPLPPLPAPLGALPGSAAPGAQEAASPPGTARAKNRRKRRHARSLPLPRPTPAASPRASRPAGPEITFPFPGSSPPPQHLPFPAVAGPGVPGKQAASPPAPRGACGRGPGTRLTKAAPGTSIFQWLLSAGLIKGSGDAAPPVSIFSPPPPPTPNTHTWDRLLTSESSEGVTEPCPGEPSRGRDGGDRGGRGERAGRGGLCKQRRSRGCQVDFYCFPPTSKSILSAVSCPSYSLYKRLRWGWRRWSSLWIRRERRDGRGAGGPAAEYSDSLPFADCCRPGSGSRGKTPRLLGRRHR